MKFWQFQTLLRILAFGITSSCLVPCLAGSSFQVLPDMPGMFNNLVIDSNVLNKNRKTGNSSITLHIQCYGTNLRSVPYPMSPYNNLIANISLKAKNGTIKVVKFQFPALISAADVNFLMADSNYKNRFQLLGLPADLVGIKFSGDHRIIRLDIPDLADMTINADGTYNVQDRTNVFSKISFVQTPISIIPTGTLDEQAYKQKFAYLAQYSGPLSGAVTVNSSSDLKNIHVYANFPGSGGFCGSYYSPIMLFFDNQVPQFLGDTEFKLSKETNRLYWPEKNAPGYFLALDRNKNGKIDDGTELFGDQKSATGFEYLKFLDENKDQILDQKDPQYSQLLLWRDINSDGVSQKSELFSLKALKVIRVDLETQNKAQSFGDRAEFRQVSHFVFIKDKQEQIGQVVDIYLKARSLTSVPTPSH